MYVTWRESKKSKYLMRIKKSNKKEEYDHGDPVCATPYACNLEKSIKETMISRDPANS